MPESGSLVHGRDHKNETPLLTAFRHNKFEIVDLLIKKGARRYRSGIVFC
jgi:ankyrin repeat protein